MVQIMERVVLKCHGLIQVAEGQRQRFAAMPDQARLNIRSELLLKLQ